jgi:hypothetical protein
MKKGEGRQLVALTSLLALAAVIVALWYWLDVGDGKPGYMMHGQAYRERSSDVMVEVSGQVVRILKDDRNGGMVQKFVVRTSEGFDVLVTHPYDVKERVPVAIGDFVVARGDYEWNETGGQVDWTTYDMPFSDRNGWIMLGSKKYD